MDENKEVRRHFRQAINIIRTHSTQEISIDAFLQVTWEDPRLVPDDSAGTMTKEYMELTPTEQMTVWVPDLYIRQLREMRVMTLFEEISKLRLYKNSTLVLTKG